MWSWFLNLYIANIWICAAKLIGQKIFEYNHKEVDVVNLKRVTKYLNNASRWPMYAFLFMWPIMGVIIALAMLFGQDYDSIIKAWTETSDWNLSTRVASANIQLDQHYLCTVAARGHKDFVKPIRLGYRRGNYIVVNRQLCVASAFEQLLEERTPKLHKALRSFYDKYGLPIARIIRSPFASDFVYILMKPLEWIFLGALYLFDIRPEVRIAQQYLPREDRESIKKFIESSN